MVYRYFNTGMVRNFGHINNFLELWARLFKENSGTCRLTMKSEGTQHSAYRLISVQAASRFKQTNNMPVRSQFYGRA